MHSHPQKNKKEKKGNHKPISPAWGTVVSKL